MFFPRSFRVLPAFGRQPLVRCLWPAPSFGLWLVSRSLADASLLCSNKKSKVEPCPVSTSASSQPVACPRGGSHAHLPVCRLWLPEPGVRGCRTSRDVGPAWASLGPRAAPAPRGCSRCLRPGPALLWPQHGPPQRGQGRQHGVEAAWGPGSHALALTWAAPASEDLGFPTVTTRGLLLSPCYVLGPCQGLLCRVTADPATSQGLRCWDRSWPMVGLGHEGTVPEQQGPSPGPGGWCATFPASYGSRVLW